MTINQNKDHVAGGRLAGKLSFLLDLMNVELTHATSPIEARMPA